MTGAWSYQTTCPLCAGVLYPVALDPRSAPWICVICRHAWWVAELSEAARKQFRPHVRDFGYGESLQHLQRLIDAELAAAIARGTSVRTDQLELLPAVGLRYLGARPLPVEFRARVEAELARKEGL